MGTARALLRSHGIPFTELDVTARPLTVSTLIDAQGVGRYQAVVLTSSGLSVETAPGVYGSALDAGGWATLFAYEKAYGVRQLALFGYPGSQPEDYGLRADGDVQTGDTRVSLTPAARRLFSDLTATPLPVRGAARYPARRAGVQGVETTPLITDPQGGVLAATSTADGRERLLLTLAQNPGMLHTQFLGHGLVQWLTRGVYLGEYRRFLQVDVDDWFLYADRFDPATGQVVPRDYRLGAADALSLRDQQRSIRQEYAVARGFRLAQAFNGLGADPGAPDTCRPGPGVRDPLSAVTRCIAGSFDWVNHTRDHLLMDSMSEEKAVSEMAHNREIGRQLGLPLSTRALITPELSGLGWKAPSPGAAKQDFGLAGGNPAVYRAARQLGLRYVAANHSVPSQWDPACPNCGVFSPLDPEALLIPRWPNDVPYNATTPAEAVGVFNARRTPSGKAPLNYAAFLEQDTARSLVHVLSGTAWPHYMHQGNLREYAPDRSLVTDWVRALLDRYTRHSTLPLQTLTWDELGTYVGERTHHERTKDGVSAVWDRRRGQVTLRARGPGAGKDGAPVVFLTGVADPPGAGEDRTFTARTHTYGARTTARLRLGDQALTLTVAPLEPTP
jgi:peptidoglycan/xylan/chitin deacetylase (PgdA/CDA1 family)